mmetsp:Transcript_25317/g.31197  ORF Transcript_25317/g.31197 Transcript_25317/m.31197 type:complete len:401 (+) Transcript_25317:11-1213(+)
MTIISFPVPGSSGSKGNKVQRIYTNKKCLLYAAAAIILVFAATIITHNEADTNKISQKSRPFSMPEKGDHYELFQPIYDMDQAKLGEVLFSPTKEFIKIFQARIEWLKEIVPKDNSGKRDISNLERAQEMYLEFMKSFLTGTVYNGAELSVKAGPQYEVNEYDAKQREGGKDWTYLGDTMTGNIRIQNVWDLLVSVVKENIPGDYIETGVWRGGSSIFARAVLSALDATDRVSYVCDSFAGLPPGDRSLHKKDKYWDTMNGYLGVSEEVVAANFQKFGLLDSNVVFAKGFFNETMPVLSKYTKTFAVMRLDGDMYESTVDVLYNLYDKLSIGGYLIMDDWNGYPSRVACLDFFEVHGIQPKIIHIDEISAYWKKTEEIDIQYWRYEQNKFKAVDKKKEIS